jgi:hypothetical protein
MWRPTLTLHTGLLVMEGQQALVDVLDLFEQSSSMALAEYLTLVEDN